MCYRDLKTHFILPIFLFTKTDLTHKPDTIIFFESTESSGKLRWKNSS
jgi:hypothetical protein